MNVGEIIVRVKRQFGDEAAVQITDADIIRWINDAQREITTNTDLLQVRKQTDLVAGQSEYQIPPDISKVRTIRIAGEKIKNLSIDEADEYMVQYDSITNRIHGQPLYYWQWGESYFLYPVPDSFVTLGITLYCSRFPIDVANSTDIPEINQAYHQRIVEWCLNQAYQLDENSELSQLVTGAYNRGMQNLSEEENWTEQGTYPTINVMPEDM